MKVSIQTAKRIFNEYSCQINKGDIIKYNGVDELISGLSIVPTEPDSLLYEVVVDYTSKSGNTGHLDLKLVCGLKKLSVNF